MLNPTKAAIAFGIDIPKYVTVRLECFPEELDIDGNASAWGEPEDSEYAESIRTQLDNGNPWAWCMVCVTVSNGLTDGTAFLGGCSYASRDDFIRADGDFPDMVREALDAYQTNLSLNPED